MPNPEQPGLTFQQHAEMVLQTLRELIDRSRQIKEMRLKTGRPLSKEHRERLLELAAECAALSDLIRGIMIEQKKVDPKDAAQLFREFEEIEKAGAERASLGH